jgi:hypothetical protein
MIEGSAPVWVRIACSLGLVLFSLPHPASRAASAEPLLSQQALHESTHASAPLPLPDASLVERPKKSPLWAMFASTVLPGGGQVYTENRLRGLFFLAAQGAVLTKFLLEHTATEDALARYQRTHDYSDYLDYDHHFSRRYDYLWWCGLVWGVSIADAYVDAHLYAFDEDGTPHLVVTTSPSGPDLRVMLAFSF